jgi:hypothetical protein
MEFTAIYGLNPGFIGIAPHTAKWKTTPAWKVIKAVSDLTAVPGKSTSFESKFKDRGADPATGE